MRESRNKGNSVVIYRTEYDTEKGVLAEVREAVFEALKEGRMRWVTFDQGVPIRLGNIITFVSRASKREVQAEVLNVVIDKYAYTIRATIRTL